MSQSSGIDLVTGGAGFIGGHLVAELLSAGRTVRVLDVRAAGLKVLTQRHSCLAGRLQCLEGSVATPVTAGRACDGVERVFHLAAQASVARSVAAPLETYRVNATGTAVILEAAARAGVERLVLASTCAVYPDSDLPVSEKHTPRAVSPYAASKLAAEAMVTAAGASTGLRVAVLRLFNVYGPGQRVDGPYAAVIPAFVNAIKQGKQALIYGDGGQTRDFVHVLDAVVAMLRASELEHSLDYPVNIGSGQGISIASLHEAVSKAATASGLVPHKPEFRDGRPGELRHSVADNRAAKLSLGWQPQVGLASGLSGMFA